MKSIERLNTEIDTLQSVLETIQSQLTAAIEERNELLNRDLAEKIYGEGQPTVEQVYQVLNAEPAVFQAQAAEEPCPSGQVLIQGTIISAQTKEYQDAPGGTVAKQRTVITVRDDRGFRVWGTLPANTVRTYNGLPSTLKGIRVAFEATVEPSSDDTQFGFYKYPKNGRVI